MTLDHLTRLAAVESRLSDLATRLDHIETIAAHTSAAVADIATVLAKEAR